MRGRRPSPLDDSGAPEAIPRLPNGPGGPRRRGLLCGVRYLRSLQRADVAELVDAHGSGPCLGNQVEVRVLSSALAKDPANGRVLTPVTGRHRGRRFRGRAPYRGAPRARAWNRTASSHQVSVSGRAAEERETTAAHCKRRLCKPAEALHDTSWRKRCLEPRHRRCTGQDAERRAGHCGARPRAGARRGRRAADMSPAPRKNAPVRPLRW